MGLWSMPAPSDGVMCLILMNTAISIAVVKAVVRTILQVVGIHLTTATATSDINSSDPNNNNIYQSSSSAPVVLSNASMSDSSYHYYYYCDFYCGRCPPREREAFRRRQAAAVRLESLLEQEECRVCLNGFDPESELDRLCCGHVFHRLCLDRWLDYRNFTCPLCRTPIFMISSSSSSSSSGEEEEDEAVASASSASSSTS